MVSEETRLNERSTSSGEFAVLSMNSVHPLAARSLLSQALDKEGLSVSTRLIERKEQLRSLLNEIKERRSSNYWDGLTNRLAEQRDNRCGQLEQRFQIVCGRRTRLKHPPRRVEQ